MKYNIFSKIVSALFIVVLLIVSSCKKDMIQNTGTTTNLYSIINDDVANFSLLKAAIDRAGLADTLKSLSSNLTILAPVDEVFTAAGFTLSTINATNPAILKSVLQYHLIGGSLNLDNSFANADVNTISNSSVYIAKTNDGRFAANGADITNPNKKASNGMLHVVNRVLMSNGNKSVYQQVNTHPDLTFLAVALRRASTGTQNLVQQLNDAGTYTLFAPNNAAFIAAGYADSASIKNANPETLANILTYHLLNAKKYTVDMIDSLGVPAVNQKVVYLNKRTIAPIRVTYTRGYFNDAAFDRFTANITATNGVVHVIPELIIPPTQTLNASITANTSLTLLAAAIVRASQGNANFTALLEGSALYTIFAPTNAAFNAAGYANVAAINTADPVILANILNAHILTGNRFSFQFRNNSIIQPLSAINLAVTINNSNQQISLKGNSNLAAIPVTRTLTSLKTNGIIYTVDQLILP